MPRLEYHLTQTKQTGNGGRISKNVYLFDAKTKELNKTFLNASDAADFLGIHKNNISTCILRRRVQSGYILSWDPEYIDVCDTKIF